MLCDNSVGVLYNDSTRMILHENGEQVQYVHKDMRDEMCTIAVHPSEMQKKISLIKYFRKYMNDHLLKVSLDNLLLRNFLISYYVKQHSYLSYIQ